MASVSEAAIRARLHTATVGQALRVVPTAASTNTLARDWALAGAPIGAAVVADAQTAGRGRRGRAFFSPAGGVYLSIVLPPDARADERTTSRAAAAVWRAVSRLCAAPLAIKWVNDLLLDGRKLAGILVEAGVSADGAAGYTVLGIGINVGRTAFPPELAAIATSLANEGVPVDRNALIAAILEEWERLGSGDRDAEVMSLCRTQSAVLGRPITVWRGDDRFNAVAEAITDDGHLIVVDAAGRRTELSSGEVSIRPR